MKVYENEIVDGLAEKIKASASVTCSAKVMKDFDNKEEVKFDVDKLKAFANVAGANPDQPDLYYMYSVLASLGWNGNDDVFIDEEMFKAKNSPVSKAFNYMHDDKYIVGNVTSSIVVDQEQNVIGDDDERPEDYDIVIGSVIYRAWEDEERKGMVEEIIEKSEAGEGFVSMECLFNDFDYAIVDEEGKNFVVARNEETSFLTKHLRSYGGKGTFKNYTIGRVLKNITFSGVGFVDDPANKRSIVFHNNNPFTGASKASVDIFKGDDENMSESNSKATDDSLNAVSKALQSQIDTLQSKAERLTSEKDEAVAAHASEIAKYDEKVETLESTLAEKDKTIAEAEEKFEAQAKELADAKETIAKVEAEKVSAERVSKLVEVGVASEDAVKTVEKWAGASDEQFESIVELSVAAFKKEKAKDDEKKEDKKDDKAEASEDTSEDVDVELEEDKSQADLSHKPDEAAETRKAVANTVRNILKLSPKDEE